jgi:hypothetical protein
VKLGKWLLRNLKRNVRLRGWNVKNSGKFKSLSARKREWQRERKNGSEKKTGKGRGSGKGSGRGREIETEDVVAVPSGPGQDGETTWIHLVAEIVAIAVVQEPDRATEGHPLRLRRLQCQWMRKPWRKQRLNCLLKRGVNLPQSHFQTLRWSVPGLSNRHHGVGNHRNRRDMNRLR